MLTFTKYKNQIVYSYDFRFSSSAFYCFLPHFSFLGLKIKLVANSFIWWIEAVRQISFEIFMKRRLLINEITSAFAIIMRIIISLFQKYYNLAIIKTLIYFQRYLLFLSKRTQCEIDDLSSQNCKLILRQWICHKNKTYFLPKQQILYFRFRILSWQAIFTTHIFVKYELTQHFRSVLIPTTFGPHAHPHDLLFFHMRYYET